MFSKFFSSHPKSSPLEEQLVQQIVSYIEQYRSQIFPQGLFALTKTLTYWRVNDKKNEHIAIEIVMPFPCQPAIDALAIALSAELEQDVIFTESLAVEAVREHNVANIKNIIAVASGKGGVGKSTTSVNLAYGLIAQGAKVGILDADIYGPSIPTMLAMKEEKPTSTEDKKLIPLLKDGLTAMSIGFLVEDNQATIWRGPMASRAFEQLLNETQWPALDYLIIDMPPGTGDIQLTLAQTVPVAASVVVTTPQDIALIDAVKGIAMFEDVNVPVLGVVENMSYHVCESCGHQSYLFGEGGGKDITEKFQTLLLGQIPLNREIRLNADQGDNLLSEKTSDMISNSYLALAEQVASQLYYQLDMRSPTTAKLTRLTE